MAKRRILRPKDRFDVFKRDGFQCQYCGRTPPEVVLVCDHIRPVSSGGTNDQINLVTSCEACNQGKAASKLECIPTTVVEIRQREAELLEQTKACERLRRSKARIERAQLDEAKDAWEDIHGWLLPKEDLASMRLFISKIGISRTLEAILQATRCQRSHPSQKWRYFCGICWSVYRQSKEDRDGEESQQ